MAEHYTKESDIGLIPDGPDAIAEANKMHHLATADPEPERGDGTLTGPAHEAKHGLERAEGSAEHWRDRGVDPMKNGALKDAAPAGIETASAPPVVETAAAPRASD
jgi:hypothetical protein